MAFELKLFGLIFSCTLHYFKGKEEEEKLKIAWRYENQSPKAEEFSGKVTNHHFNLNKTLSQDALTDVLTHWSFDSMSFDIGNVYHGLYNDIRQAVESFKIDPKVPGTNMMRIGISDIGSALLSCPNDGTKALMLFLYRLRALARSQPVSTLPGPAERS